MRSSLATPRTTPTGEPQPACLNAVVLWPPFDVELNLLILTPRAVGVAPWAVIYHIHRGRVVGDHRMNL